MIEDVLSNLHIWMFMAKDFTFFSLILDFTKNFQLLTTSEKYPRNATVQNGETNCICGVPHKCWVRLQELNI